MKLHNLIELKNDYCILKRVVPLMVPYPWKPKGKFPLLQSQEVRQHVKNYSGKAYKNDLQKTGNSVGGTFCEY